MKNGILLINKPKGMTSRDVVNVVGKKLGTRKVGHTGTLDPMATGLMIICVNKATSLVELITSDDKEYLAKVRLGVLTDTLDVTGNILKEQQSFSLSKKRLIEALNSFIGSYEQEVPAYSAVKVNGKRLYEYAREGIDVSLPTRMVTIKELELIEYQDNSFTFKVTVSKGTYIRSLIRDIGNKLGIYMTMEELVRTKIDTYDLTKAIELEKVTVDDLISIECFLPLPKIIVDSPLEKKIINGVRLPNVYGYDMVMFLNENHRLLAIYRKNDHDVMCLYKLF